MTDVTEDLLAESLARLEREKRIVDTLYRVAKAVAEKDELREIVQLVTDETTQITEAQFGAFFYNVVRRDGELLALYTISGAPRESFEQFPMPRATEIFRPTFEGTAIVRLDDVLEDPRFGRNSPYNGMPKGHLPVRSYLAVPVFSPDGSVVGGLFFGHEEVGRFSEDHEHVAAGIATHAGMAIQKARLLAAEREARAEAEARADAAISLEYVEDGVIMVDRAGFVRLWNRAAEAITGQPSASVLGRPIGEALPTWERIALDVPVGTADHPVAPKTLPLDTLHGREVWVSLYGVSFDQGTVYAFRDVTTERELEGVLADVIATVSHELRTPIAAVYGAAQTLARRQLEPEVAGRLLDILGTESERLSKLVDEILLTSQLDAGGVHVESETIEPRKLVESVARSAAIGTDVQIVVDAPSALPAISADGDKLRQVLSNLVENAIKYGTPREGGTVTVRLRTRRDRIRFEIADEGPGIAAQEHGRIFEKFYRLDPQLTHGVRGTGLGLYICRELVRRMNGSIGVESAEGRGATFWLEFRRQEMTPAP